jgi:hypothetical protein
MIEVPQATCTSTPVKRRPSCRRNILEDTREDKSTFSDQSGTNKKHELTPESKAFGVPARK